MPAFSLEEFTGLVSAALLSAATSGAGRGARDEDVQTGAMAHDRPTNSLVDRRRLLHPRSTTSLPTPNNKDIATPAAPDIGYSPSQSSSVACSSPNSTSTGTPSSSTSSRSASANIYSINSNTYVGNPHIANHTLPPPPGPNKKLDGSMILGPSPAILSASMSTVELGSACLGGTAKTSQTTTSSLSGPPSNSYSYNATAPGSSPTTPTGRAFDVHLELMDLSSTLYVPPSASPPTAQPQSPTPLQPLARVTIPQRRSGIFSKIKKQLSKSNTRAAANNAASSSAGQNGHPNASPLPPVIPILALSSSYPSPSRSGSPLGLPPMPSTPYSAPASTSTMSINTQFAHPYAQSHANNGSNSSTTPQKSLSPNSAHQSLLSLQGGPSGNGLQRRLSIPVSEISLPALPRFPPPLPPSGLPLANAGSGPDDDFALSVLRLAESFAADAVVAMAAAERTESPANLQSQSQPKPASMKKSTKSKSKNERRRRKRRHRRHATSSTSGSASESDDSSPSEYSCESAARTGRSSKARSTMSTKSASNVSLIGSSKSFFAGLNGSDDDERGPAKEAVNGNARDDQEKQDIESEYAPFVPLVFQHERVQQKLKATVPIVSFEGSELASIKSVKVIPDVIAERDTSQDTGRRRSSSLSKPKSSSEQDNNDNNGSLASLKRLSLLSKRRNSVTGSRSPSPPPPVPALPPQVLALHKRELSGEPMSAGQATSRSPSPKPKGKKTKRRQVPPPLHPAPRGALPLPLVRSETSGPTQGGSSFNMPSSPTGTATSSTSTSASEASTKSPVTPRSPLFAVRSSNGVTSGPEEGTTTEGTSDEMMRIGGGPRKVMVSVQVEEKEDMERFESDAYDSGGRLAMKHPYSQPSNTSLNVQFARQQPSASTTNSQTRAGNPAIIHKASTTSMLSHRRSRPNLQSIISSPASPPPSGPLPLPPVDAHIGTPPKNLSKPHSLQTLTPQPSREWPPVHRHPSPLPLEFATPSSKTSSVAFSISPGASPSPADERSWKDVDLGALSDSASEAEVDILTPTAGVPIPEEYIMSCCDQEDEEDEDLSSQQSHGQSQSTESYDSEYEALLASNTLANAGDLPMKKIGVGRMTMPSRVSSLKTKGIQPGSEWTLFLGNSQPVENGMNGARARIRTKSESALGSSGSSAFKRFSLLAAQASTRLNTKASRTLRTSPEPENFLQPAKQQQRQNRKTVQPFFDDWTLSLPLPSPGDLEKTSREHERERDRDERKRATVPVAPRTVPMSIVEETRNSVHHADSSPNSNDTLAKKITRGGPYPQPEVIVCLEGVEVENEDDEEEELRVEDAGGVLDAVDSFVVSEGRSSSSEFDTETEAETEESLDPEDEVDSTLGLLPRMSMASGPLPLERVVICVPRVVTSGSGLENASRDVDGLEGSVPVRRKGRKLSDGLDSLMGVVSGVVQAESESVHSVDGISMASEDELFREDDEGQADEEETEEEVEDDEEEERREDSAWTSTSSNALDNLAKLDALSADLKHFNELLQEGVGSMKIKASLSESKSTGAVAPTHSTLKHAKSCGTLPFEPETDFVGSIGEHADVTMRSPLSVDGMLNLNGRASAAALKPTVSVNVKERIKVWAERATSVGSGSDSAFPVSSPPVVISPGASPSSPTTTKIRAPLPFGGRPSSPPTTISPYPLARGLGRPTSVAVGGTLSTVSAAPPNGFSRAMSGRTVSMSSHTMTAMHRPSMPSSTSSSSVAGFTIPPIVGSGLKVGGNGRVISLRNSASVASLGTRKGQVGSLRIVTSGTPEPVLEQESAVDKEDGCAEEANAMKKNSKRDSGSSSTSGETFFTTVSSSSNAGGHNGPETCSRRASTSTRSSGSSTPTPTATSPPSLTLLTCSSPASMNVTASSQGVSPVDDYELYSPVSDSSAVHTPLASSFPEPPPLPASFASFGDHLLVASMKNAARAPTPPADIPSPPKSAHMSRMSTASEMSVMTIVPAADKRMTQALASIPSSTDSEVEMDTESMRSGSFYSARSSFDMSR